MSDPVIEVRDLSLLAGSEVISERIERQEIVWPCRS